MFYTTELNTYHCCSLQYNETLNLKKKRSTRLALDWQTTARQRGWSRVRFPGPESYGCTVFALQTALVLHGSGSLVEVAISSPPEGLKQSPQFDQYLHGNIDA